MKSINMYHFSVSCRDNGESWRQQPATSSGYGFSVLEAVCRLWGQNRRPFPPLHHGELLAQPMPQVLLLPGAARRNRNIVLHKKWYDSLQKWLYQVRWKNALILAVTSTCYIRWLLLCCWWQKIKEEGKLCFSEPRTEEVKYAGFTLEFSTCLRHSVISRTSLTIRFNTCKLDFS